MRMGQLSASPLFRQLLKASYSFMIRMGYVKQKAVTKANTLGTSSSEWKLPSCTKHLKVHINPLEFIINFDDTGTHKGRPRELDHGNWGKEKSWLADMGDNKATFTDTLSENSSPCSSFIEKPITATPTSPFWKASTSITHRTTGLMRRLSSSSFHNYSTCCSCLSWNANSSPEGRPPYGQIQGP